MTEQTRFERVLPGLFDELAAARTPAYLEAAIEGASSRPQRSKWTYPGRWLAVDIAARAMPTVPVASRQLAILILIAVLLAAVVAVYIGAQQRRLPEPFGLAGNGVVALAMEGDIVIADRPGGDLRPLVVGPELDQAPMFSPDGSKLAFMRSIDGTLGRSGLMVADADGSNIVQLTPRESLEPGWKWSFAPDSRSLIGVARIDGENRVVLVSVDPDVAATILDVRLPRSSMDIQAPTFRPTNPREVLVVAQPDPDGPLGLYVYDLATGSIRTIVERPDAYPNDVAWLPDGEHLTYGGRIVAADGSGDQALDTLQFDQLSPLSNDGTRVVLDVPEVDLGGDDSNQRSVVVPFDGQGQRVELACGFLIAIECASSWIWSPDDSMLIGTVSTTYLQADPDTGQVTQLGWVTVGAFGEGGAPAWQRVAP